MSRTDELLDELAEQPKPNIEMMAPGLASVAALGVLCMCEASETLVGVCCTLNVGRYAGRRGVIVSVIPDHEHGLRLLVHVERHDRRGFLDGDAETRSYWALKELTLDEDWLVWTGELKKVN